MPLCGASPFKGSSIRIAGSPAYHPVRPCRARGGQWVALLFRAACRRVRLTDDRHRRSSMDTSGQDSCRFESPNHASFSLYGLPRARVSRMHAPSDTIVGAFIANDFQPSGDSPPICFEPAWRWRGASDTLRPRAPIEIERYDGPLFISHGEDDSLWTVGRTKRLESRLRAAGRAPEVHIYKGEGHHVATRSPEHALPACRRLLRPGADRRQPLAPSSHDGPGRSIPDSPDHGAMQGAPLLRQDHAMKSVCERTAAGGIRGGRARSHSARTTLCDARVTYRRARLGRARLCPMESHLIPLIPVNPT